MPNCVCHVAAQFPILGNLGIISANLRTNVEVTVTEAGLVLYGPAFGDFSITAYAPLTVQEMNTMKCPGRAGVSYNWDKRYECEDSGSIIVHFIPRGRARSYQEGDIVDDINMTTFTEYDSFSASAASGPATPYFYTTHKDGYDFAYTGQPISISEQDGKQSKSVSIFNNILPAGSELYLQSFGWEYTPPNIPQVTYSFLFSHSDI